MDFSYKHTKLARDRNDVILRLCQDKRVLHIGAADSPYTRDAYAAGVLLHKRLSDVSSELVGIDLDRDAAQWLNERGLPEIKIVDLNEVAQLDLSPDIIVFGETIEHVANPGNCLDTLISCMNKKTKLIISTPNCFQLRFISQVLHNHEKIHDDHKIGFTYGLLMQLLTFKRLTVDDFYFTFLSRIHYEMWRHLQFALARYRHGFAETLLVVCSLDDSGRGS